MSRRRPGWGVGAVALALVLSGCGAVPSAPSASRAGEATSPAASATGSGLDVPVPGRPFNAAGILAAMAGSRRPGGVPAELQSEAIAAAVADVVWTFDGSPWPAIAAGGTCGSDTCTLELAGAAAGSVGEDVWVLRVDPTNGSVAVEHADLHAVPTPLANRLDAHVRESGLDLPLDDLLVTSVRWRPPPDEGTFELSYRSGNEEGSCALELEVDARTGDIATADASGC
jgi:hypothetical protein